MVVNNKQQIVFGLEEYVIIREENTTATNVMHINYSCRPFDRKQDPQKLKICETNIPRKIIIHAIQHQMLTVYLLY